jgi:hypothetical protein
MQEPPAVRVAGQPLAIVYWLVFRLICRLFNEPVPVFETVTVCGALVVRFVIVPKFKLVGLTDRDGTVAATPVPVSETTWGTGSAESLMVILPGTTPTAVGANLTTMLQLRPARRVPPQVVVNG